AIEELRPPRRRASSALRLIRANPVGAAAAVVCIVLVLVAIGADWLAPYSPEGTSHPRLQAPSWSYPFGTDNLFRDMFTRVIIGSRISLGIGFGSVAIGTVAGTVLGLTSGYFGGWIDMAISRLLDVLLGFPPLVFAVFFLSIFNTDKGYTLRAFFMVS